MKGRERTLLLAFIGGMAGAWTDQALGTMGTASVLIAGATGFGSERFASAAGRDHHLQRVARGSEAPSPDRTPTPWAAWAGSWVALLAQPPISWMSASMITMSAMMGAMAGTGDLPPVPRRWLRHMGRQLRWNAEGLPARPAALPRHR